MVNLRMSNILVVAPGVGVPGELRPTDFSVWSRMEMELGVLTFKAV